MKKAILSMAVLAGLCAAGSSAMAQPWPASVVGVWDVRANQSHLTLTIRTQAVAGVCKAITGLIQNVGVPPIDKIQGFYCPGSGRISFQRITAATNDTYQTWTGNLSDPGARLLIGGTFTQNPGGNIGEYGFYAVK
jgi:hypothetical protein